MQTQVFYIFASGKNSPPARMNKHHISKAKLKEIADYRGNLSFAEEDNPIPFKIKSVFWGIIEKDHTFYAESDFFLLPLDGKIMINKHIALEKPCTAANVPLNSEVEIQLNSKSAIILIVSNKKITEKDFSKEEENGLLAMPRTKKNYGIKGYFANSLNTLPFDIKRVYFTYDIPDFAERGGHAHMQSKGVLFSLRGQCDVLTETKEKKNEVQLNKKNTGVFLDSGTWRVLKNFKNGSLLLVLSSETYTEKDYIRSYCDFIKHYEIT